MIYMLTVNILVAVVVLSVAGLATLAMFAWTEAKEYALARRAMQRIVAPGRRESFANSQTNSRTQTPNPSSVPSFRSSL